MPEIVLTTEQAKIVAQSLGSPITVRNERGAIVGHLEPKLTPEMIAELKRRAASPGPFYSGAQVQARLKALQDEWGRTGGFDEGYMREFLSSLDKTDPPHMRPREQAG